MEQGIFEVLEAAKRAAGSRTNKHVRHCRLYFATGLLRQTVPSLLRDALTHRGPDDAGEWWSEDGCVGLGHRRLSIIDLSSAGHQPMADASGELWIVFNGESYNFAEWRAELVAKGHAFRSHSDTEVILAAYGEWGTECRRA